MSACDREEAMAHYGLLRHKIIKYYDCKFVFTLIIRKGKGHSRTGHEGPEGE